MLNTCRDSRLLSWEAELDLLSIQSPFAGPVLNHQNEALPVQPPHMKNGRAHVPGGTQTPLHRAAIRQDIRRLTKLLGARWPTDIRDQNGETVGDIIAKSTDPRFRQAAQICLKGNPAESQPRLFYDLGSGHKWIRPDDKGYWRHLTSKSYSIYSDIYDKLARDKQGHVSCR